MDRDVIIACDFASRQQLMSFLESFGPERPFLKIGMELYYAEGPDLVRRLKDRGHKIFLDLKLHDIPNTVKKAMQVLSGLDADIVNVHAAGTVAMMKAALEGAVRTDGSASRVIAVTQLTSTGEEQLHQDLGIAMSLPETVLHYAKNARAAGLDGVVCSALEAGSIHEALGRDFLTVTPGIRFAGSDPQDQKRIATPALAGALGADLIVVGRPITQAAAPAAAYAKCCEEFLKGSVQE